MFETVKYLSNLLLKSTEELCVFASQIYFTNLGLVYDRESRICVVIAVVF